MILYDGFRCFPFSFFFFFFSILPILFRFLFHLSGSFSLPHLLLKEDWFIIATRRWPSPRPTRSLPYQTVNSFSSKTYSLLVPPKKKSPFHFLVLAQSALPPPLQQMFFLFLLLFLRTSRLFPYRENTHISPTKTPSSPSPHKIYSPFKNCSPHKNSSPLPNLYTEPAAPKSLSIRLAHRLFLPPAGRPHSSIWAQNFLPLCRDPPRPT